MLENDMSLMAFVCRQAHFRCLHIDTTALFSGVAPLYFLIHNSGKVGSTVYFERIIAFGASTYTKDAS